MNHGARGSASGVAAAEDGRARVPRRCLLLRDERFPSGVCDANRSRTARRSLQQGCAKGWAAPVRPQEHEWAVRQAVGGELASIDEHRRSPNVADASL
jgi:hypothetical protein